MILSVAFLLLLMAVHAFVGDVVARVLGIVGLLVWCAIRPNDNRRIRLFLCSLGMLFVLFGIAMALGFVNSVCQFKYDLYLHAIDHTLGFCPAQIAARLASPALIYRIVVGFYQLLPTMMVAGYGWALYNRESANRLLGCYAISASSVLLYMIVPAAGPGFVLGSKLIYPHPAPRVALIHLNAVANCIPSLHLSTAILIWIFNRSNKTANAASLAFVFITAFSTLALGEHYLIDLVLSFPFSVFVLAAITQDYRRSATALCVVIAWLVSIRLAIESLLAHPGFLWLAAALTVAVSCAYLLAVAPSVQEKEQPTTEELATVAF